MTHISLTVLFFHIS